MGAHRRRYALPAIAPEHCWQGTAARWALRPELDTSAEWALAQHAPPEANLYTRSKLHGAAAMHGFGRLA